MSEAELAPWLVRLKCAGIARREHTLPPGIKWCRYFPSAEYPRGFAGGITLKLHCFFPHFEHCIRFSTSTRRASHPHNRPSVCGSAVRSWPQAEHVKTKVYCPNSSLNLLIRNSRAISGIVASQNHSVHPVLEQCRYCIENCERRTDRTESYSSCHIPTLYEMNSRQTAPAPRGRRPLRHLTFATINTTRSSQELVCAVETCPPTTPPSRS